MQQLTKFLEAVATSVDGNTTKLIVQQVNSPADKIDIEALRSDLSGLNASIKFSPKSQPSKMCATDRRKRAKTIQLHAEKLFNALSDDEEFFDDLWRLMCDPTDTEYLGRLDALTDEQKKLSRFVLRLGRSAKQVMAAADEEIQASKHKKEIYANNPALTELRGLFGQRFDAHSIIAFGIAPLFEKHFGRKATAVTPSQGGRDRIPAGPFVQFVQAIEQHLHLISDSGTVSPHTVAKVLLRTKEERDRRRRLQSDGRAALQDTLEKNI
jgi:hypothetical protein